MKKMIVLTFVCLGLLLPMHVTAGEVGFIDLQRVIADSNAGKKGAKEIDKMRAKKLKQVSKLEKAVKLQSAAFEKAKAKGVSEKKLMALAIKAQKKETALKRLIEDVNGELLIRRNKLSASILEKANDAMLKVAKEKKLTVIYKNADNLAYLAPAVDITKAVIKIVNKKTK